MKQESKNKITEIIKNFQLPTYREIPEVGLYLDQTVKYINTAYEVLPNVEITSSMVSNYVKQGIIASKIAAHAADIAKGIPHARDIDDKMADARRALDWDAQFECALDPETAKAIRDSRSPEDDHSEACSMCGKFCAVRSMNKALSGEYIDIL